MKTTLENDHYTYRVTWSEEDRKHVSLCSEFPSLSCFAAEAGVSLNRLANDKLAN